MDIMEQLAALSILCWACLGRFSDLQFCQLLILFFGRYSLMFHLKSVRLRLFKCDFKLLTTLKVFFQIPHEQDKQSMVSARELKKALKITYNIDIQKLFKCSIIIF